MTVDFRLRIALALGIVLGEVAIRAAPQRRALGRIEIGIAMEIERTWDWARRKEIEIELDRMAAMLSRLGGYCVKEDSLPYVGAMRMG